MTTGHAAEHPLRLERAEQIMGATFSIELHGDDRAHLAAAAEAAFAEATRLDGMLSNYRDDSEWTLVNRTAAAGPVRISAWSSTWAGSARATRSIGWSTWPSSCAWIP